MNRPSTASPLDNPERKHSSLFGMREGGFFKRKGYFLSGFCLPSIQVVWRGEMQYGRDKAKLFLREEKDLFCLGYFFCGDMASTAQEGAGGMRSGNFSDFFGEIFTKRRIGGIV